MSSTYHSGGYYYEPGKTFFLEDNAFYGDQNEQLMNMDFHYVIPQVYQWTSQASGDFFKDDSAVKITVDPASTKYEECKWLNEWHGHEKLLKVYARCVTRDQPYINLIKTTVTITRYKNLQDIENVVEFEYVWEDASIWAANQIVQLPDEEALEIPDFVGSEQLIMTQGNVPRWKMGVSLKFDVHNSHPTSEKVFELNPVIVMIYPRQPSRTP